MISSKLARLSHRATTLTATAPTPTLTAQRSAQQCLASTAQHRPSHQRRHSSSKPSCPPDSSDKPAPAAKASDEGRVPAGEKSTRRASKLKRAPMEKGARGKEREAASQFAGLPAVPEMHLGEKDFWLSAFFSLHQPLSLTNPVPSPVSDETFSNIFSAKPPTDAWENGNSAQRRPEDVIITLHSTIDSLENSASGTSQEESVRWEVLQESQSNADATKHLDGNPASQRSPRSIDELVAQFRPFHAPPPPQPFPAESKSADSGKKHRARAAKPANKSFQTTIVVTESTTPDGQRTYTASQSPLVQLPNPDHQRAPPKKTPFKPFAQRRAAFLSPLSQRTRSLGEPSNALRGFRRAPGVKREQMRLISVKRQRKLKMKKHKYKKLMKRTRNLRRRLDRA